MIRINNIDRFSSMRSQGQVINIGGEDNLSWNQIGAPISAEALTTIGVGDRFKGIKNDENTDMRIVSTAIGVSFAAISENLAVGIPSQSFTKGNPHSLKVYFLNDLGSYSVETYDLNNDVDDLMTFLGVTSWTPNFRINEDGTFAALIGVGSKGFGAITMDINIKTREVSFYKVDDFYVNYYMQDTDKYNYYNNWSLTASSSYTICGKYIIFFRCTFKSNYLIISSGSEGTLSYVGRVAYYHSKGNVSQAYLAIASSNSYYSGHSLDSGIATQGSIYILAGGTGQETGSSGHILEILKFNMNGSQLILDKSKTLDYSTSAGGRYTLSTRMSNNAKYFFVWRDCSDSSYKRGSWCYSLDLETLETKTLRSIGYYDCVTLAPTDDGIFWYSAAYPAGLTNNLPSSGTAAATYQGGAMPSTQGFDIRRWISGSNLYSLVPATSAEYLIEKCVDLKTESNKIYGVCSEDIIAGNSGTARLMFSTYTE